MATGLTGAIDQTPAEDPIPIVGPIDGREIATPLHVQRIEHALRLEPLIGYVDNLLKVPLAFGDVEDSTTDADTDNNFGSDTEAEGVKIVNGIVTTKAERKADKTRLYNFSKVKKNRRWLKNILLSDSSSDENEDAPVQHEQLREMLKFHKNQRMFQADFYKNRENGQYRYYSSGMLSNYDKFPEHQKMLVGPKKKEQKRLEKKMKARLKKLKKEKYGEDGEILPSKFKHGAGKHGKQKKLTPEQAAVKRRKIWLSICKKEISKEQKRKANGRKEMLGNLKKVAQQCQKEARRSALQSQKTMKEAVLRARRLSREMLTYWKRFEKVEKEHRKRAEKEAQEQRKMDVELMEAKRQQRKLNFLISQTELYAHFMARKLTGESDEDRERILRQLDDESVGKKQLEVDGGVLMDQLVDDYDSAKMKQLAMKNAQDAYDKHTARRQLFDDSVGVSHRRSSASGFDSTVSSDADRPQPSIFEGALKGYQLKGMNWLANLYDQGINGILADEMGLGKTVQSMAFLAHLAEACNIWGPFLVVAPASTLHNWQQECSRFVPKFKCVPYWGNTQDRKILRKFWNSSNIHSHDASFHIVITSYQLVIQDVKYFQKINWHYMILDEAQAIKSSSSIRWKILLGFNCRNRLLLTGTPIQNSMAELWALLHFIMPTLFDSHDEFNEWFSKDIESHAEKQSGIDQDQLSRLHMILKPFMLRRVKKDVENELSDKIEILVHCPLTTRQRLLYQAIKNKISIDDLLQSATASSSSQAQTTTSSLMNLVMQFRKVCNHPELFERRETRSGFSMKLEPYELPKLIFREGILHSSLPSWDRILYNLMYIFNPDYIHHSLFPQKTQGKEVRSCFSYLRFIDVSPMEMYRHMFAGLHFLWLAICMWWKTAFTIHHQVQWQEQNAQMYLQNKEFLLEPIRTTSVSNIDASPHLRELVFTSPQSSVYSHLDHTLHSMAETVSHRKIRWRNSLAASLSPGGGASQVKSPTSSPTKSPHSPTKKSHHHHHHHSEKHVEKQPEEPVIHKHVPRPPHVIKCLPTEMPPLLYYNIPKVYCKGRDYYCPDRSAEWVHMKEQLCGTLDARNTLLYGSPELALAHRYRGYYFDPVSTGGLHCVQPKHGYSSVFVPDKETLVTDAGKLHLLDTLLARLKKEGHRVLIYSQMTRMIDILEEYMWHRKHTYMRLDGSSKISDRRDMVADFQNRSDIFVFLLSTRAGGLGINLTAADTVIFYDSDWNPTVDQQAMDRAHRLGQTKQVTVYRMICKGTIEERILQRAKEKSEIQRMVISGGSFRPDVLKPKEVVSLLLDDDEMEKKLHLKQNEKKGKEDTTKEKDRKRKREKYAEMKKGQPGRKRKSDEHNMTTPGPDIESLISDSGAASPLSVVSTGSEVVGNVNITNDDSNDGLIIVDDAHSTFPSVSSPSTSKRGTGRSRGRPKGSGAGKRPRGRGSVQKAISAAEIAGAQAGVKAAYEAYGYNFKGGSAGSLRGSPRGSGASRLATRGSGRGTKPS